MMAPKVAITSVSLENTVIVVHEAESTGSVVAVRSLIKACIATVRTREINVNMQGVSRIGLKGLIAIVAAGINARFAGCRLTVTAPPAGEQLYQLLMKLSGISVVRGMH